MLKTDW